MKLAVVRESQRQERRVAATPDNVRRLAGKLGFEVLVERGAGVVAGFADVDHESAGASLVDTAGAWGTADVVLKVNPPSQLPDGAPHEVDQLRPGAFLVSFIYPGTQPELLARLSARGVTVLAMDQVPRVNRAQKMDAFRAVQCHEAPPSSASPHSLRGSLALDVLLGAVSEATSTASLEWCWQ
jgi:NAD(P) transhydrogenase subunit alpha